MGNCTPRERFVYCRLLMESPGDGTALKVQVCSCEINLKSRTRRSSF